jgi:hypothetical protein
MREARENDNRAVRDGFYHWYHSEVRQLFLDTLEDDPRENVGTSS